MSRRTGKNGKERRAARRQRDREWIQVQATILRIEGMREEELKEIIEAYPTKGMFSAWLQRRTQLHEMVARRGTANWNLLPLQPTP